MTGRSGASATTRSATGSASGTGISGRRAARRAVCFAPFPSSPSPSFFHFEDVKRGDVHSWLPHSLPSQRLQTPFKRRLARQGSRAQAGAWWAAVECWTTLTRRRTSIQCGGRRWGGRGSPLWSAARPTFWFSPVGFAVAPLCAVVPLCRCAVVLLCRCAILNAEKRSSISTSHRVLSCLLPADLPSNPPLPVFPFPYSRNQRKTQMMATCLWEATATRASSA